MEVTFNKKFSKDLDKIGDRKLKHQVKEVIISLEVKKDLKELNNVRKLSGFEGYYRIRVGDYRIGLFKEGDSVELLRIAHRKDIYKYFP